MLIRPALKPMKIIRFAFQASYIYKPVAGSRVNVIGT
jgi:hypothetical protein